MPVGTTNGGPDDDLVLNIVNLRKVRQQGDFIFELVVPELRVRRGQFVAIVGESGCGKSTLLDMLGLLLSPTSGDRFEIAHPSLAGGVVDILKQSGSSLSSLRRKLLGYVLQTGGLLPFLRVGENITLTRRINGQTEGSEDLGEVCARLKISSQWGKYPAHLSGGQRQRVAIARALAHQPPIVLADEPTAAVDKLTAREIRDTFKELTDSMGVTVVMVTHDLDLVAGCADRRYTFDVTRLSPEVAKSVCYEAEEEKAGHS